MHIMSKTTEFISNTFRINNKKLQLKKFQIDLIQEIEANLLSPFRKPIVIIKSRQVEVTTLLTTLLLAKSYLENNFNGTYLSSSVNASMQYSKGLLLDLIKNSKSSQKKNRSGHYKSTIENTISTKAHGNTIDRKSFINGSNLFIKGPGHHFSQLRGMKTDLLVFDEVFINKCDSIQYIEDILATHSVLPIYILTADDNRKYTQEFWRRSKRHYFHLWCSKCLNKFPLYKTIDYNNHHYDWKNILYANKSVRCPKCGHCQEKHINYGHWAIDNPNGEFIGFHMNQLLFNDDKYEPIRENWQDERSFMNEVLGDWTNLVTF